MYVDCFVEMVYIKIHIVLINVSMLSAMSLEHIRLMNINDSTNMTHCRCELVHNQLNIKLCKLMHKSTHVVLFNHKLKS